MISHDSWGLKLAMNLSFDGKLCNIAVAQCPPPQCLPAQPLSCACIAGHCPCKQGDIADGCCRVKRGLLVAIKAMKDLLAGEHCLWYHAD